MVRELPKVTMNGVEYYLDMRLNQLRTATMEGPIDFISIVDLPDEQYEQIRDVYLKELGLA